MFFTNSEIPIIPTIMREIIKIVIDDLNDELKKIMTKSNIKIRPAEIKEVIGTGGIGSVYASFDRLKSILGEPHDCATSGEWESRDKKVRVEWAFVINNDKRLVFTIYDYKRSEPLENIKRWNLGGKKGDARIIDYLESVGLTAELK